MNGDWKSIMLRVYLSASLSSPYLTFITPALINFECINLESEMRCVLLMVTKT